MEPDEAYYNGDYIPLTTDRLTPEQKLELLDWHPIFTGRCPNCERPRREASAPRGQWNCDECGWVDSV